MKKISKIVLFIIAILIIFMIFPINNVLAQENEEIIEEQKEEFGINTFLSEVEKYKGEFFENIDIDKMLEEAISGKVENDKIFEKILSLFGIEVLSGMKAIFSILAIIVIHSILKAISDNLENNAIGKLIYYVQYIIIVTIIMGSFSDILKMVEETSANLVGFMNILVPLLTTLMISTGSITTSSIIEPITIFLINFIGNIIQTIIIPLVLIFTSLVIISKISNQIQIDKIAKFLKSGIVWFLGIVLTVFVGVISLEGTLSSSVDGITAKTTKAVVSSAVPVVRKNPRRCCRYCFGMWNNTKKCNRNNRSNNNCWNMYNANYKTCCSDH